MAVEAQNPAKTLDPEFQSRVDERTNVKLQQSPPFIAYNNTTIIKKEEDPQNSELTCHVIHPTCHVTHPLPKKRALQNPPMSLNPTSQTLNWTAQVNQTQLDASSSFMAGPSSFDHSQMIQAKRQRFIDGSFRCPQTVCGNVSVGNNTSQIDNNFLLGGNVNLAGLNGLNQTQLGFPSTSGRMQGFGLDDEILSIFNQFDSDAERLISIETQRIRLAMEEERKRFYHVIMSELTKGPLMQWLIQKKSELDFATKRNSDLEQKLNQIQIENQAWINIAKNNEAIVASLKAQIDQTLKNEKFQEGCGDTDEIQSKMSACESVTRGRKGDQYACRVCGANDAIKLVLPCRHLALCEWCDVAVLSCPVCAEPKLSSVPVRFS